MAEERNPDDRTSAERPEDVVEEDDGFDEKGARVGEKDAGADGMDARADESDEEAVPEEVVAEAERLTRLAEEAADDAATAAYREHRDELVEEHDFTARVREEDDTLVLYPEEWVDDGVVQFDRIEDTDRAVEVSLSGPDAGADWEAVEAANRAVVEAVEERHGPDHAANVRAFADFMGNHYLKRVTDATRAEREEFLTEYYPRNAWPSKEQESIVAESVELVTDVVDDGVPGT